MTGTQTLDVAAAERSRGKAGYNYALGYLRAFLVTLVIAAHAMLAYHPYGPRVPVSLLTKPRWWQAFGVVDPRKCKAAYFFFDFNERFLMALMFFLSGLFVWQSLKRKGSVTYLRDRLFRLGLPFLLMLGLLAPIAHYTTYLQIPGHDGVLGFLRQWRSPGTWTAGPAWFLWVLFVFDCMAALLLRVWPHWGETIGRIASMGRRRPGRFFAVMILVSVVCYVPLGLVYKQFYWTTLGPFIFPTGRILLQLAYFLIGVAVGAFGLARGLLAPDSKLPERWPWWVAGALAVYGASTVVTIRVAQFHTGQPGWEVAACCGYALSCAASSFASLSFFLRFFSTRSRVFDSLAANSYAIYLVHWIFVLWLQYALLKAQMHASEKFVLVFAGALLLSWGTAATVRRIPLVARIV